MGNGAPRWPRPAQLSRIGLVAASSGDRGERCTIDRFALFTITVLIVDLVFGGATQPDEMSTLIARLFSAALVIAAVWRLRGRRLDLPARIGLALMAAIVALPILQSIPLPPSIWEQLPGRPSVARDYAAAAIPAPWLPISLTPYETQDVVVWLLPPCAMFLAALSLGRRAAVVACAVVPAVGVIAVALGLMQVLGGPESVLRLYEYTNPDSAVGFFANRNHEAAFLVVGLAFAPLWIIAWGDRETSKARLGSAMAVTLQILLVVGIGVTKSRAGVLIGVAVLIVAAVITAATARDRFTRRSGIGLALSAVFAAALIGLFARTALVERFQAPLGAELRLQTAPLVARAAGIYFPFGSGLGSFDPVYRSVEPLKAVSPVYFNHAHDDAMELIVETGAFGGVVIGAFVVWWLWATMWWIERHRGGDLALYASLSIAALITHSLVDYPMRTTALACLFALACGVIAGSANSGNRRDEPLKKVKSTAQR